jgi:hypothetical protein
VNEFRQGSLTRVALTALAAWVAFLTVDFVSHGMVLSGYWRSTAGYWRPPAELFHLISVGYVSAAIYCSGLCWLFVRFHPATSGVKNGIRLGVVVGLIFSTSSTLGAFSVFRMPFSAVVLWSLVGTLESVAAGAAMAWVLGSAHSVRRTICVFVMALVVVALGIAVQNLLR